MLTLHCGSFIVLRGLQVLTELKDQSLLSTSAELMSSNIEAELGLELKHFKQVKGCEPTSDPHICNCFIMISIIIILHSGIPAEIVNNNSLKYLSY